MPACSDILPYTATPIAKEIEKQVLVQFAAEGAMWKEVAISGNDTLNMVSFMTLKNVKMLNHRMNRDA
ncbi:hypothetical protein J43TS9_13880 [Paenibacillus cineris]|nr:hypothetical protein J43TS9_13880 [Paenibacillus cineris]